MTASPVNCSTCLCSNRSRRHLTAVWSSSMMSTNETNVPYGDSVLPEALTSAVRAATKTLPTNIGRLQGTLDNMCLTLAKLAGRELRLIDVRDGDTPSHVAYNRGTNSRQKPITLQIDRARISVLHLNDETNQLFSTYEEADLNQTTLDDLASLDESHHPMDEDFDCTGWHYDAVADDFKVLTYTAPNVKRFNEAIKVDELDLVLVCSSTDFCRGNKDYIQYVLGFSPTDKIVFGEATINEDGIILIKDGLGICLVHCVTDIVFLDSGFKDAAPGVHLIDEFGSFVTDLNYSGDMIALDRPQVRSVKDMIKQEVNERFNGTLTFDHVRVSDGEQIYKYKDPASSEEMCASFDTLVHEMCTDKHVMRTPNSRLCMTMKMADMFVRAASLKNLGASPSLLYTVNRRFVCFLYTVGYPHEVRGYETLDEAFSVYYNIQTINTHLTHAGGTLEVDMRPFQSECNQVKNTLMFENWREVHSGMLYDIQ